jgi:hypothetical protein
MLKTLIRKEITETILDLRFWIVTALFLILIPLGMYVSRKDYERRLANYQQEHQMYREHYGKDVGSFVEAQGFRPPPLLSIFALGLDPFMPSPPGPAWFVLPRSRVLTIPNHSFSERQIIFSM